MNRKVKQRPNNRTGMTFNGGQYNIAPSYKEKQQSQNYGYSENVINKRQCPKITQYIADKPARLKSYFRRRHVPFKRTYDMNLQCGTTSLLIQISDDIEECLYHGDERLVEQFLDTGQGVNLSLVNQIIQQEKGNRRIGLSSLEDYGYNSNENRVISKNKTKSQPFK